LFKGGGQEHLPLTWRGEVVVLLIWGGKVVVADTIVFIVVGENASCLLEEGRW